MAPHRSTEGLREIVGTPQGQALIEAINAGRGDEFREASAPPALTLVGGGLLAGHPDFDTERDPPYVPPASSELVLEEIPLDLVDVGTNVRVTLEGIEELTASIAEHGVLQPVKATLRPDGRYELLWGQRRVLAARAAGLATVPALVERGGSIADRPIEQLVENLHRADLNPIDRATAMRAVVDTPASARPTSRASSGSRPQPCPTTCAC